MSEENEPDWLAELAKGGEAVRAQIEPILQAAQQFVRDAQRAKTSRGPALPFAQRVALAVDAGLRELLPARMDADVRPVTLEASVTFPAVIVASGGLVLSPMSIAGQATVQDRRAAIAGQVLVLVIVWLLVLVLPVAIAMSGLSPGTQLILDIYYAALPAIAVEITRRCLDKHR